MSRALKDFKEPNENQLKFLEASLKAKPTVSHRELAEEIGVHYETVKVWFRNKDFEQWWVLEHFHGDRARWTPRVCKAIFEKAVQPDATAKDRELALQILDPAKLNKTKAPKSDKPPVLVFIGGGKELPDMEKLPGILPPKPKLIDAVKEPEQIEEADAEVRETG